MTRCLCEPQHGLLTSLSIASCLYIIRDINTNLELDSNVQLHVCQAPALPGHEASP